MAPLTGAWAPRAGPSGTVARFVHEHLADLSPGDCRNPDRFCRTPCEALAAQDRWSSIQAAIASGTAAASVLGVS